MHFTQDQLDLMSDVRDIVQFNPERWNQETWISNHFTAMYEMEMEYDRNAVPVDDIRRYAHLPIPLTPRGDPDKPICGTKGCVAGWAAILSAPKGSLITSASVIIPDLEARTGWRTETVKGCARKAMGISDEQAGYLFSANRTRNEVLDALDYIPAHSYCDDYELARECGDEAEDFV